MFDVLAQWLWPTSRSIMCRYPAGFVYLYSLLYYITKSGHDLRTAQYLFAGFYLLTLSLVLAIYSRLNKVHSKLEWRMEIFSSSLTISSWSTILHFCWCFWAVLHTGFTLSLSFDSSTIPWLCCFSMLLSFSFSLTDGSLGVPCSGNKTLSWVLWCYISFLCRT